MSHSIKEIDILKQLFENLTDNYPIFSLLTP